MRNKTKFYILAAIAVLAISTYMRLLPYITKKDIPLEQAAESMLIENLKFGLEKHIARTYPEATANEKAKMLNAGMSDVITKKKESLKKSILEGVKSLKQKGYPAPKQHFLIEADSYYYLGLMKNIIETGRLSPLIKNGLYFNPLMMAPLGNMYYYDLHPYVGFFIYKITSFFSNNIPLEATAANTSILLALFGIIIFMLFAYSLEISCVPMLTAAMFFSASPIFLQRSLYGWFDTDPYNVIFPLALLYFLFKVCPPNVPERSLFSNIIKASIITGLYSMFWSGWVYAFLTASVFLLATVIYSLAIRDINCFKSRINAFMLFVGASSCAVLMLRGLEGFAFSFTDTFSRAGQVIRNSFTLWPDAFITVGELKSISLAKIAVLSGGRMFAIVSLLGMGYLTFSKKDSVEKTKKAHFEGLLLFIFILIPFIMSRNAERFTILIVPPMSLAFLLFLGHFYKDFISGIKDAASKKFFSAAIIALTVIPLLSSYAICTRKQPVIYNETWDKAMTYLYKNTPPESIINTWWPPGHFITGVARRGVLFDGATLEKPVGYWICRFFMSHNEAEALGILRMLDTTGNNAVEFLVDKGYPLSKAISILNKILPLNTEQAKVALYPVMKEEDILKLTSMTHGTPMPGYVFIYNDLAEKVIAMEFMGLWDFKKAENYANMKQNDPIAAKKFLRATFQDNYVKLLWGISGGPLYYEDESPEVRREGNISYFKNGLKFEHATRTIGYNDQTVKLKGNIGSIIYFDNGVLKEDYMSQGKLALVLLKHSNKYSIIVADKKIAGSMLFRLYYFDAAGLGHFKLCDTSTSRKDNTKIKIFEVKY